MHARRTRLGPSSAPSVALPSVCGGPGTKAAERQGPGFKHETQTNCVLTHTLKGGGPGTNRARGRRRSLGKGTKQQDNQSEPKH